MFDEKSFSASSFEGSSFFIKIVNAVRALKRVMAKMPSKFMPTGPILKRK